MLRFSWRMIVWLWRWLRPPLLVMALLWLPLGFALLLAGLLAFPSQVHEIYKLSFAPPFLHHGLAGILALGLCAQALWSLGRGVTLDFLCRNPMSAVDLNWLEPTLRWGPRLLPLLPALGFAWGLHLAGRGGWSLLAVIVGLVLLVWQVRRHGNTTLTSRLSQQADPAFRRNMRRKVFKVALGWALLVLLVMLWPQMFYGFGPMVPPLIGIAFTLNWLDGLQRLPSWVRMPLLAGFVLWVGVVSWLDWNDNHQIRLSDEALFAEEQSPVPVSDACVDGPLYVLAAQGGGIYAAHHLVAAYERLTQLDPCFQQRLLAISAVSGGAVGTAMLAAQGWNADAARDALRADLLTPLLWRWLFADMPARLGVFGARMGSLDRARALEDGLVQAAGPRAGAALRAPLVGQHGPLLLFNATSVTDGRLVVFSNVPEALPHRHAAPRDIRPSLVTAAVVSARFPYITPAATVGHGATMERLVDGGYADNSGITTALDLIDRLGSEDCQRVRLIALTAHETPPGHNGFAESLSPILALNATRQARSRDALRQAQKLLPGRVFPMPLDLRHKPMPLGWWLGAANIAEINRQMQQLTPDLLNPVTAQAGGCAQKPLDKSSNP